MVRVTTPRPSAPKRTIKVIGTVEWTALATWLALGLPHDVVVAMFLGVTAVHVIQDAYVALPWRTHHAFLDGLDVYPKRLAVVRLAFIIGLVACAAGFRTPWLLFFCPIVWIFTNEIATEAPRAAGTYEGSLPSRIALVFVRAFRGRRTKDRRVVRGLRPYAIWTLMCFALAFVITPAQATQIRRVAQSVVFPWTIADSTSASKKDTQTESTSTTTPRSTPSVSVAPPPGTATTAPAATLESVCHESALHVDSSDMDDLQRRAMETLWHRLGAIQLGCPTGDSFQSGDLTVVWFSTWRTSPNPTEAAIVANREEAGVARAVFAPQLPMLRQAISGDSRLKSVSSRASTGDGDFQLFFLSSGACQMSLRPRFRDSGVDLTPDLSALTLTVGQVKGAVVVGVRGQEPHLTVTLSSPRDMTTTDVEIQAVPGGRIVAVDQAGNTIASVASGETCSASAIASYLDVAQTRQQRVDPSHDESATVSLAG